MLEKRRTVRYCLSHDSGVAIEGNGGGVKASLVDVSTSGLMVEVPEAAFRNFLPGCQVSGELRSAGTAFPWRGTVVHRSPVRHGLGVGIAFSTGTEGEVSCMMKDVVQQPEAGGIHLREDAGSLSLSVFGRLSFPISRRGLLYSRLGVVSSIDLRHCHSIDSAGIGMLSLARERNIAIVGACGAVRKLLDVAEIPVTDAIPRPAGRPGMRA